MAELVYPPVIWTALRAFGALGLRFSLSGQEHVPDTGGAVLASNHVSYLDFIFVGLAAHPKRLVRFMAKDAVFHNPVSGPLMRGMHHIPVDRTAGTAAFGEALKALRSGELVGVFPEATISRSFMVKDVKSGAARLAMDAEVPLLPVAVWGGQRIYTKGHKRDWGRGKAISIAVGEPLYPKSGDDQAEVSAQLRSRIQELVDRLQREYPDKPSGDEDRWWLPASLGGTAPTPQEAAELDRAEADQRMAAARERAQAAKAKKAKKARGR